MGVKEANARLREALDGPGCSVGVPVVDVLTARLAQEAGWGICKLNSSSMKATNYGLPDEVAGIVTVTDYADVIRRIRRTVHDIAVTVDADDCGGTPETVTRWVSDMEAAGVSGIEIEDRGYLPMSAAGSGRVATVHPIEAQVANLEAALAARNDPSTVIIARTCAFSPTMVDDVPMSEAEQRERIRAYAGTGVDAIFLPGTPSTMRSDIELIHSETDLPLIVLRMPPELCKDKVFLEQNNVRIRYISQSTIFGKIVPFVFDLMKQAMEDDGTRAMSEEDAAYGQEHRASELGKGSTAALSLITTPRFRHEFVA